MAGKSFIDQKLETYIESVSAPETPILARLREETSRHPEAEMQITAQQGQILQILVKAIGAARTLEVGVFTGYSSLAVALALPETGRVTALDLSEDYTAVARRYWEEARVSHKIDLRIAPATASLERLRNERREGSFDFAFIDADKPSYPVYFEHCIALVRTGGLIAVDNTLQKGKVAHPGHHEANTIAVREFNKSIRENSRVLAALLPIADGLTLAVKL